MESAVLACDCDCEAPTADAAAGGDDVVMLRRSALAACLTCPLCGRLLRDAATITECLHTFCRKCISEEFICKEVCCCPICSIDLGCAPLEKLRVDRSLQYVRSKVFPFSKKQRVESPEVTSLITSTTETANKGTSSTPDNQTSEAATAGASVGTDPSQAQMGGDPHAWEGPWIPVPEATLVALDDGVRRMATAMSTLCDISLIVESLHGRSKEKSMFIRQLWDRLADEKQLREGLTEQLDALESAEFERLRKERDDLLQAIEELRAERDSARQRHADAQEVIDLLRVERDEERGVCANLAMEAARQSREVRRLSEQVHGLHDRLTAEVVKNHGLEKELAEVKDLLLKESDEHDALRVAVGVVCDDLKMVPEQGASSLADRAVQITERAREMARNALHFGVHQSMTIARSHFEKLEADLATMSQGFPPGYSEADLEEIEKMVTPCRRT